MVEFFGFMLIVFVILVWVLFIVVYLGVWLELLFVNECFVILMLVVGVYIVV